MPPPDETLTEDNAHVQELKRLFLSCDVDENNCLSPSGLSRLCEKLKLSTFASEITERVLCGGDCVNFLNFKERFVALLPEIIDVSSGTVDQLVSRSVQTAKRMGLGDGQRLTRYETRLLCENTNELDQLSAGDVNVLFERADPDRHGRVSVQQFLQQYRLQKRLSAEVHFIADSFVSTLNLFDALDTSNTGTIDSHDLLEYWSKAGLRIDEGISVLKQCGQPVTGEVNAVFLSGFLERELGDAASEAPVVVKTAILALHSCIDYLRCSVKEGESKAEHLHKQLQLANQRRTLLIEELEHNQLSIEQGYEGRLRETEERYRARLNQMEEKYRSEKKELATEVERCEEELSRSRQAEASSRNKAVLVERQCARLNEESREFSETISQLEQLNRQLRTELSKAMQPRPTDENGNSIIWKQKLELLVAHNKRLREKILELTANQKKKAKGARDINPHFTKWTNAFRTQVNMIKKRRQNRGDTLSEMDSEPESIFFRARRRKLLKRKERRQRHERVSAKLQEDEECSSSTAPETSQSVSVKQSIAQRTMQRQLEEKLLRLQEDHKKEIAAVKVAASKTLADALNEQQNQLSHKWDKERRQFDQKIASERAQLERQFADEKLKIMNRLQDDFDGELKRISSMVNRPESAATVEQYKRQIKMLESSLEGQRNGYEKRLSMLREKVRNQMRAHNSSTLIDKNTTNFISLMEQYKNCDPSCSAIDLSTRSSPRSLNVEKRPFVHHHQPFQRSMSSMCSRCERCDVVDARLRELYHTCTGDSTTAESGIEDLGSSAGSSIDDKIVLKREIRKLKGRLEAATEKVTELRVICSMQGGVPNGRYKCSLGGSEGSTDWRRTPLKWSEMTGTVERLESEKVILEARLAEAQTLIKNLVEQYKTQLDETARLGGILQDMCAQNPASDTSPHLPQSAPPTSRPTAT